MRADSGECPSPLQAQNKNGDTPLLQAVAAGQRESVAWFIDVATRDAACGGGSSGAGNNKARRRPHVFSANRNGMTPVMVAAARANLSVLGLLLSDAPEFALALASHDKDGYAGRSCSVSHVCTPPCRPPPSSGMPRRARGA